jgi:hypothetical protein
MRPLLNRPHPLALSPGKINWPLSPARIASMLLIALTAFSLAGQIEAGKRFLLARSLIAAVERPAAVPDRSESALTHPAVASQWRPLHRISREGATTSTYPDKRDSCQSEPTTATTSSGSRTDELGNCRQQEAGRTIDTEEDDRISTDREPEISNNQSGRALPDTADWAELVASAAASAGYRQLAELWQRRLDWRPGDRRAQIGIALAERSRPVASRLRSMADRWLAVDDDLVWYNWALWAAGRIESGDSPLSLTCRLLPETLASGCQDATSTATREGGGKWKG